MWECKQKSIETAAAEGASNVKISKVSSLVICCHCQSDWLYIIFTLINNLAFLQKIRQGSLQIERRNE